MPLNTFIKTFIFQHFPFNFIKNSFFLYIKDVQTIHFPIYYCFDNYEILKIYENLQDAFEQPDKKPDELMFIVRVEEPKLLSPLILEDFYVF